MAANLAEKVMGPGQSKATISTHVSRFPDSGEKMLALQWFGRKDVRVQETNKATILDDEDIIVKVTGSTVCGSDMHLYHGAILELRSGDILGHEFMGVVEQVGPKVKKTKVGDRGVASFQVACGKCEYCQKKLSSMCVNTNDSSVQQTLYGATGTAAMLGYSHTCGGFAGAQAEYVRLPYGDVNFLKLPESIPDEAGLYLSDVLCTAYHCVVDTGVEKGDVVAVWGLGAVGLLACKFALFKGAKRVIGIDNNWRMEYAKKKIPEMETLDYSGIDVSKKLIEMTDGKGLDVALECAAGEYAKGFLHKAELALGLETDTSEIVNEMILAVRPFGRIGITGVYAGLTNHFNLGAVMEKGVRFIGNGQAPVHLYWEMILHDYLESGKLDVIDLIVTNRYDLKDAAKVYQLFEKWTPGMEKVFIQTKFSSPPAPNAPKLEHLD